LGILGWNFQLFCAEFRLEFLIKFEPSTVKVFYAPELTVKIRLYVDGVCWKENVGKRSFLMLLLTFTRRDSSNFETLI
jgi:hypothetical protein